MPTGRADFVSWRETAYRDSHQAQRIKPWTGIDSERDAGQLGPRESMIVAVRLAPPASAVRSTSCDRGDHGDTGLGTEKPIETLQVNVPLRITRRGSVARIPKHSDAFWARVSMSHRSTQEESWV